MQINVRTINFRHDSGRKFYCLNLIELVGQKGLAYMEVRHFGVTGADGALMVRRYEHSFPWHRSTETILKTRRKHGYVITNDARQTLNLTGLMTPQPAINLLVDKYPAVHQTELREQLNAMVAAIEHVYVSETPVPAPTPTETVPSLPVRPRAWQSW